MLSSVDLKPVFSSSIVFFSGEMFYIFALILTYKYVQVLLFFIWGFICCKVRLFFFFFNLSTAYMLEILAFLVKMYYLMRKRLLLCSYWYFVKFAGWMGFCHEDECRSAGSFSVRGIFVL